MSRVFILGAGFSKPAGLPLATELTEQLLDRIPWEDYELKQFANRLERVCQYLDAERGVRPIGIEELAELVAAEREALMLAQHRIPVGRSDGSTPFAHAEALIGGLRFMDELLVKRLVEASSKADETVIDRFVEALSPGDTIITFNYDCMVERSLKRSGVAWSFGFHDSDTADVRLLKLHGSLDWFIKPRSDRPLIREHELLWSKIDKNAERAEGATTLGEREYDYQLYRLSSEDILEKVVKNFGWLQDFEYALAGIGPAKRPSRIPGLGELWNRAHTALCKTSGVVCCGFSFSPYDRLAFMMFASAMAWRHSKGRPLPRTSVIDPRCSEELKEQTTRLFREPHFEQTGHEHFDWRSLSDESPQDAE